MRCMIKAQIPLETGNDLIGTGRLPQVLKNILEDIKPESVYFLVEEGHRAMVAVVDIADPAKIPAVLEPIFLGLGATVQVTPCFNLQDMERAAPDLQQAARKYGSKEPALAR